MLTHKKNKPKKTLSDWRVIIKLLNLMLPYTHWLLLSLLLSLLTVTANISLMALSAWFITSMAYAGLTTGTMDYYTPSASIRGLAIVRTVSRYLERIISHETTFRLIAHLRLWFFLNLEPLIPHRLKEWHSGDLLNHLSTDMTTLENFYLKILSPVIVAIIGTLATAFFLFLYDSIISLIVTFLLISAGFIIPLFSYHKIKQHGEEIQALKAKLSMTLIDSTQGLGDSLIYGFDTTLKQRAQAQANQLQLQQKQLNKWASFSQNGVLFFANLAMWFILLLGIPLFQANQLSGADLALLILFTLACFEAVIAMPLAFSVLPETLSAARRIFAVTDITQQSQHLKPLSLEPQPLKPLLPQFNIQFSNVDFSYPNTHSQQTILKQLDLSIPQGKKIAIIGKSGIGKSTIAHLLMCFYQADRGQISINEQPIEAFDQAFIRQHISIVNQHPYLFNSTIKANLYLANKEATEKDIIQACRLAELDQFIITLPKQYDTWIGETGVKLSGGQVKRLAIARALLKPSSVLILDEPGESLDITTEKTIINNILNHFQHKKTIILISHHSVGLQKMDEIIELT